MIKQTFAISEALNMLYEVDEMLDESEICGPTQQTANTIMAASVFLEMMTTQYPNSYFTDEEVDFVYYINNRINDWANEYLYTE